MEKNIIIQIVERNKIVVQLVGNVYVEQAAELREKLLAQIESGTHYMKIDVNKLKYIDSSGLGVLIAIHKRCMQKGGEVIIKGLTGNIKELFELTRLNKVFKIEK